MKENSESLNLKPDEKKELVFVFERKEKRESLNLTPDEQNKSNQFLYLRLDERKQ